MLPSARLNAEHYMNVILPLREISAVVMNAVALGIRPSITIMAIMTVRSIFLSSITAVMRSKGSSMIT